MNRSRKVARYGRLAEEAARRIYDLGTDHASWHDAHTSDGRPVETKAAMLNRANGTEGRFRIFEGYHERLVWHDGLYVFIPYHVRGRGIWVVDARSVETSKLRFKFYGAGGYRESQQVKIHPRRVFGQSGPVELLKIYLKSCMVGDYIHKTPEKKTRYG